MSALEKIQNAESIHDIAEILGYKASALAYIIYKIPIADKYSSFEINKSGGGKRKIDAPIAPLKDVQRRLANILYACRHENEKQSARRPLSHGYRKGLSIVTNANCHKRQRYVLNLDLKDFFPTINFGRVRGFFQKNREFGLNEKVATIVAQIACYENALPQGSPCSPVIADLIAHLLDIRMVQLAKKCRTQYSRYADDLTFSTNQRIFPEEIAVQNPIPDGDWQLADKLLDCVHNAGFEVNPVKTRMQVRTSRQTVTGLTVNAKVNIRADYYRSVRAMCHSVFNTGSYYRPLSVTESTDEEGKTKQPELMSALNPLEGMLSHIYYVKKTALGSGMKPTIEYSGALRTLYQRFLRFRYFVVPDKPLVICEGKTDNIYIRSAIRSLAKTHPKLGSDSKEGLRQAVSFFNYETQAGHILNIKGGTGDLKFLILDYEKFLTEFKHRPLKHPVVLLIDNDDGASPIFSLLKEKYSIDATFRSANSYYYLGGNLYLVKTPSIKGKIKTCIEDLFDDATLATIIDGKTFNPDKKLDSKTEYGKIVFAEKVIRPNAAKIDFAGFSRPLNRLVEVIEDHKPPD